MLSGGGGGGGLRGGIGVDPDALDGMSTSDACAAVWNAKSTTNEKRKARGFVKNKTESGSSSRATHGDQDPRKANSACASCGKIGHWRGDESCEHGKNGQDPPHERVKRARFVQSVMDIPPEDRKVNFLGVVGGVPRGPVTTHGGWAAAAACQACMRESDCEDRLGPTEAEDTERRSLQARLLELERQPEIDAAKVQLRLRLEELDRRARRPRPSCAGSSVMDELLARRRQYDQSSSSSRPVAMDLDDVGSEGTASTTYRIGGRASGVWRRRPDAAQLHEGRAEESPEGSGGDRAERERRQGASRPIARSGSSPLNDGSPLIVLVRGGGLQPQGERTVPSEAAIGWHHCSPAEVPTLRQLHGPLEGQGDAAQVLGMRRIPPL